MTHPVLTALGLTDTESGTYLGSGEWSPTRDAGVLESINPTNGEVLAKVQASSQADYDAIVERAQAAFKVWRTTPGARAAAKPSACAPMRCASTRTRSVRWSRWRWASPSPKATAKCRR